MVVFRSAAALVLEPWVTWSNPAPRWGALLVSTMLRNFLMGSLIVGVGHALVYAQRSRMRERQAQELQERLTQARVEVFKKSVVAQREFFNRNGFIL